MAFHALASLSLTGVLALYLPFCATEIRTTTPGSTAPISLWQAPVDLEERDLLYGPWGREHAPIPHATYRLVERKHTGINPGMTVVDPEGRTWSVKQGPADGRPSEAQVEVVMSRLLSALGYHQPPVYYLPSFIVADDWGTHREPAGRFRLKLKALKDRGEWSWQQNPFAGTPPYQGLLVVMMVLNASDLKNSNNTVYEYRARGGSEHWYVVRDIGTALGSSGRFAPTKGEPIDLRRTPLFRHAPQNGGYVEFNYSGWHQELVRGRIRAADVAWAAELLGRLDDRQWHDAFRAGGYSADQAQRFIDVIGDRLAEARRLGGSLSAAATPER